MVSRTGIVSLNAPAQAGPYSHGIVAGGFLYTAGFGPQDPTSGRIVGRTIEEQTAQVMRNILAVLGERGLDASHIVKATVHLQDLARDFVGFNETYKQFLVEPYPVRTTVGSALANILVEIDAIAVLE
jgi:reactive intermediate/imine deaminase